MMNIISNILNPETIIATVGTLGVIAIVFMETGLFFGFFLPGDSLLFTAGFLASQGYVSFAWLLVGTFVASVLGDTVGYTFGKKIGPSLFTREDSVFLNKKHIVRAQAFYEKHGKKTIVLARFLPIVRTFAPILAGVGSMPYKIFITYNILGGFLWTWTMLWLGYGLGRLIPDPDRFVIPVVLVIIAVSSAAPLRELWKAHRKAGTV